MNGKGKNPWESILGIGIVVAAAMLFFKTAEVMSIFAPDTVFGYTGLQDMYGFVTALLVEGMCLALHFIPEMKINFPAQVFKWFLFAVSGFCQVVDGFIIQNTLANQPDSIKFLVEWGVPLIPTAIFLGLLIVGTGESLKFKLPTLFKTKDENIGTRKKVLAGTKPARANFSKGKE
jgi:hypothetical protein